STDRWIFIGLEVSGTSTTTNFDGRADGSGSSTSPLTAATATLPQAKEYLVGAAGAGGAGPLSPPSRGLALPPTGGVPDGARAGCLATWEVNAIAAYTFGCTLSASLPWSAVIAAFPYP